MSTVVDKWEEAIREAYLIARGERRCELHDKPFKRFDGQGLHPYSRAVGAIQAMQDLKPELSNAEFDPIALRKAAREDADAEFRKEMSDVAVAS